MPVQAGTLRHRVQLQQPVEERNSFGEVTRTWATYAAVWARVEPLSGRELTEAAQVKPEVTHRVTLRHGSNVATLNESHRVAFGERVFEVESVLNPDERGEMIVVLCRERKS